MIWRNRSN